jgi:hydroxymethylbilane synthase
VRAERAYLAQLGGGCTLPCGALARVDGNEVVLDALLAAPDGHIVLRTRVAGSDPEEVGQAAARDLLDGKGGSAVLGVPA